MNNRNKISVRRAGRVGRVGLAVLALAAAGLIGEPALAASATSKQIEVIGRALAFLVPPKSGNVEVAVVHDPANPTSAAEAQALMGLLGAGLRVEGLVLTGRLVPLAEAAGAAGAGAVYVTTGLGAAAQPAFQAAQGGRVLTVSADAACVDAGACAMFVKAEPRVEIVVSRAALEATGVEFAAAFLMMIKER